MVNREDILKDVLFKMNYNPSKTLVENTKLMEQPEGVMDRRIGITAQNAKAVGMSQGEYEKKLQQQASKSLESFTEFISDPHFFLPASAAVITIMTGGVGGLVIAGVLEAADIALYVKEKDYTSAGIGMVFAMIPGGMLISKLGVGKITKQEVKILLKKIKEGLDLTNKEKKIVQSIEQNKSWIAKNVAKQSAKVLSRKILTKYTGKKLLIAIFYMIKYGLIPYRFGWRVTALGGGFITAMQLGKILGIGIQGLDYRNVELPENYVKLNPKQKEQVKKDILQQVIEQSPEIKVMATKEVDDIINTSDEEKVKYITIQLEKLDSELDSILGSR
jgi:hypothetical protein